MSAAELEFGKKALSENRHITRKNTAECVLLLLFSVICAVLLVCGIMQRTKLTRQNDLNIELSERLSELNGENTKLRIEYESCISLPELEETALNRLGLIRPRGYQIIKTEYTAQPTEAEPGEKIKGSRLSDMISIFSDLFL